MNCLRFEAEFVTNMGKRPEERHPECCGQPEPEDIQQIPTRPAAPIQATLDRFQHAIGRDGGRMAHCLVSGQSRSVILPSLVRFPQGQAVDLGFDPTR